MAGEADRSAAIEAEYVVVLGNSALEVCRKRVRRAVDYFNEAKENHKKVLVFSGLGTTFPGSSEAEVMRNMAVDEFGIPSEACLVERNSTVTTENLLYTRELILGPKAKTSPPHLRFTICTSTFHARRSLTMAWDILGGGVKIIHTNEVVTAAERQRELVHLDNYLAEALARYSPDRN